MARVPITINQQNQYDAILDAPYTLSAPVLAAGIYVPNFSSISKRGSVRVQIYNAGSASYVYFRGGNYVDPVNTRGAVSWGGQDTVYNLPSDSTVTICLDQYQAKMQNIQDNLIIDFQQNFAAGGTINVDGLTLRIVDYTNNSNGIGVHFM